MQTGLSYGLPMGAQKLGDKPYDLPVSSNAKRLTIRIADGCSEGPRCVFNALDCVKLQCGTSDHTSVSRITIRFALEFAGKPYDLPARSNAKRITIRITDGCSEDLRCVFNALDCVKLQRGPSEHLSASRIIIRLALELAGKPYDLLASSNAKRITKRIADGCSEGPRYVFSALNSVKMQRGPFEHPSASRITIRLALELIGKTYDLSTSSNASRFTIRLADGCSEGPRCVFSALDCIKLQCGPSEQPSTTRITIRIALELVGKPYDLPTNSNARQLTIRLIDGCSEDPRCGFSALDCVKLQCRPSEHPSVSRITIRLALELGDKPYDLSASSNAIRLTIQLADGCSKGPRCVFSTLDCVKLQRGLSEHRSASRIIIRLALEIAGKSYDLPASSNARRITIRLADVCSEDPRCVFNALDCVKLQRGHSEHLSANCITIRLALELADKRYDLPASSTASRLTIPLADGYSEGPHCVFNALDCVKLQRGAFEHPSTNRIIIRLALELVGKPYDLPASSNASRLTIRLIDGCLKDPRCVFSALDYVKSQCELSKHASPSRMIIALDCVKLQRGLSEHSSASRITIRLALELADKSYDLPASSNARSITIRIADGCSKDLRCVFNALNCIKLQRGTSEHLSVNRITIRLALELAGKPYDLPASSNAKRITKRLVNGCSKGSRYVFSALNSVKLQRRPFEHPSASRITIRLALELVELIGKPYDLSASYNAKHITKRLTDACSEGPHCVFSALDSVKWQREPFEHTSASHITIRLALELANKPYDLPASSTTSRLTIRLADGCSKGPRCIFNALNCVKLQRGPYEHPFVSRITIRLALEIFDKPYDLSASFNARRITKRLVDGCSKVLRCVFSALKYVKLQRGSFEHPSASRITIRVALELAGKPYDLPTSSTVSRLIIRFPLELGGKPYDLSASSNARRLTIRLADGCSEGPRCVFSALECIKLQREHSDHPSANRITIRFALELADKPYDLSASSNAKRITIRLADECSEDPRCVFSALNYVKLQRKPSDHTSANRMVNYVKLQCGPSEYTSAIRITIRIALELAEKPYDLPASSNAKHITKRFADGCSEGPRCVFSALDSVKLQRRPFEHPSASRVTIRLALELADKPYDLPASSNASRLTIRLVDGCSKSPRCVFSTLNCIKLQRGSYEHTSASRITICLALEIADKAYDLSASSNARRITKRLGDGCSEGTRCVFSALNCVKLQRKPFEHTSASRITIRIAL
ncbi:hypothetical protein L7F22_040205 [Adiantum nelumboides]|nr:hypothetical protein [Adiantum nelumboides]